MLLSTKLDREVFAEQNKLRSDPASYITLLNTRLSQFQGS